MNVDVLDKVRQAVASAHAAGHRTPGRPTLMKMTGATDYQVRKALDALGEDEPPAGASADEPGEAEPTMALPEPPRDAVVRLPRPWPLIFIGLAAAVAIWGGWVRLGELTGFGPINLLPGVGGGFTVNTAVVLPLSVEFYSAYALRVLLASDRLSERTRRFARRSFLASLVVGGGAQIASHIMVAARVPDAPWPVTTVVACVPLLVIGLATGLATLVKRDAPIGGAGGDRR
ncbi:hypothetical protein ATK36_4604 [Amycolatopsis sulphurea]|uniref:Uncharacterized protein n=1 Tax=Amycolatopsis sulphurea TaxID=76022 RepID=A0A2A9FE67_9PSEU|nr:hypothetical protein [Amycolatopsis sulphurea]PFG49448.1 hypothetical protein ATK36_4604 [Amycolatopsis sulphurea]